MTDADGLSGAMSAAGNKLSGSGDKLNAAADNLNRAASSQIQATAQMSNMLTTQMSALSQMGAQSMGGYTKPVLSGGKRLKDGTYAAPPRPLGMPQQMYDHNLKLWKNQMAISDGDMSSVFGPAGSLGYAEGMANMHGTVGLEDIYTAGGATSGFDMEGFDIGVATKDKNAMHYKRMEKLDETVLKMKNNTAAAAAGMPMMDPFTAASRGMTVDPFGDDPFGDPTGSGLTGAATGGGSFRRFLKRPNKQEFKDFMRQRGVAGKRGFKGIFTEDKLGLKKLGTGFLGGGAAKERYMASMEADAKAGRKPSRGRALKAGMGANLGLASMALGMGASKLASKYGSEESQSSLQAGAAMAAMSPLAGAAVAGLGTMMTSQTRAGGVASGALGGAAAGALIEALSLELEQHWVL